MKRAAISLLGAIAGFAVLAVCGYFATQLLSSNMHDRDVEAAMTAVFVAGPIGAVIGAIVGARVSRPPRPAADARRNAAPGG